MNWFLTIVFSLMEPKLLMNSSHPTCVGFPNLFVGVALLSYVLRRLSMIFRSERRSLWFRLPSSDEASLFFVEASLLSSDGTFWLFLWNVKHEMCWMFWSRAVQTWFQDYRSGLFPPSKFSTSEPRKIGHKVRCVECPRWRPRLFGTFARTSG